MTTTPVTPAPPGPRRVLLDTTLQLDRRKFPARASHISGILATFDWRFSSGISLLEFKATLIEQCIHIHNLLRKAGARFTRVRDEVVEKNHPQRALRIHIFNNMINVFAYKTAFAIAEDEDLRLAEKARLSLENVIPELYKWFVEESVDRVLQDRICCTRSLEPPTKKRTTFETNLPRCRRGKNKHCRVEAVIREAAPALVEQLLPQAGEEGQLKKTVELFQKVAQDAQADLSWEDCRGVGDSLIALEGKGHATHSLSTNSKEWGPISKAVGLELIHVVYPS